MRNLTIKRERSFVACLMKVKLYIEDPTSEEMVINGVICRKLGELKNGEERTFEIGDGAARVFAIADGMSKNYCNDLYQLPAGTEDIRLSGQNKFNPASGNAFRFADNDGAEALAGRRRGVRRGAWILIGEVVLGLIIGLLPTMGSLFEKEPQAKTFSDGGMTITLTDAFDKYPADGFDAAYESGDVVVMASKELFSVAEGLGDYTAEEYANAVIDINGFDRSSLDTTGGTVRFGYDFKDTSAGHTYRYACYIYKTADAFWMLQFATVAEDAEKWAPSIAEWAASVRFD